MILLNNGQILVYSTDIDAVRCAKLALDRGQSGAIEGPSSYFFKSPPIQPPDDVARNMLEAFIKGESFVWQGLDRSTGTGARKKEGKKEVKKDKKSKK